MSQQACVSPFADALRRARLHRSLTINDAARDTLLSDKQIIGLENDDLSYFYTQTYAERAARSYAAYLGVETTLEGAPPYAQPVVDSTAQPFSESALVGKHHRPRFGMPTIGFMVVCFCLFAYAAKTIWFTPSAAPDVVSGDAVVSSMAKAPAADKAAKQADMTAIDEAEPGAVASGDVEWFPDPPQPRPQLPVDASASTPLPDPSDRTHRFFVVLARSVAMTAVDARGVTLLTGIQAPTSGKRIIGVPPFKITITDAEATEIYYLGNRIRPNRPPTQGIMVSLVPP